MIAEKSFGEQQKYMKQAGNEKNKRHMEITIETHSITIIRTKGKIPSAHCEHCLETVTAFTPEQVAGFLQLSTTEIYQRVETKQIHLIKTSENTAMICGASLKNQEIPKSLLLTDGDTTNKKG